MNQTTTHDSIIPVNQKALGGGDHIHHSFLLLFLN